MNLLNKIKDNVEEVCIIGGFILVMCTVMFTAMAGQNPVTAFKMMKASDSVTLENMNMIYPKAMSIDFEDAAEFDLFVKETLKLEAAFKEVGSNDRFFLVEDNSEALENIGEGDMGSIKGGFFSGAFISFDQVKEHLDAGIDTYDIYLEAAEMTYNK